MDSPLLHIGSGRWALFLFKDGLSLHLHLRLHIKDPDLVLRVFSCLTVHISIMMCCIKKSEDFLPAGQVISIWWVIPHPDLI